MMMVARSTVLHGDERSDASTATARRASSAARTRRAHRPSAVAKGGLPLLDEGGHAFLLVLGRKESVEDAAFEFDALGQCGLEGTVHGLLRRSDRGRRERGD